MKVKIQEEDQYYYPDIFITKEAETDNNKYVQFEPELIVEVLSETTRTKDMIDKFIQYRKIHSLIITSQLNRKNILFFATAKMRTENGI